ncbi:hypothetical protein HMSSN139_56150 [Paenibacillus sp. HMSSN-139]|nr:hypothetical protein HMSSN139_56150 [Paenibacillus sp. HMSSN-139]
MTGESSATPHPQRGIPDFGGLTDESYPLTGGEAGWKDSGDDWTKDFPENRRRNPVAFLRLEIRRAA